MPSSCSVLACAGGGSEQAFTHFMSAVGFYMSRHPRVSYHNMYHAVDVLHATSLMLDGMGAAALLTEVEQLALLLSALCHDLDHPGLTNSFQVGPGALVGRCGHVRGQRVERGGGGKETEQKRRGSSVGVDVSLFCCWGLQMAPFLVSFAV